MSELIVNQKKDKVEVCVVEENSICELYIYGEEKENIMGNIYLGKVRNVVDGMQAAFIDIGIEKNAFISVKDAIPKVDVTKEEQIIDFKISKVLSPEDNLIVQVKKTPTQMKGARVSTHITLPGNYLVLMPNIGIVTVSQKISTEKEKDRLVKIVEKFLPDNYGVIVRTDAEGVSEEVLKDDLNKLIEQWEQILKKSNEINKVSLLYDEHELVSKIGRELINQKLEKIYVNDKNIYHQIKEYIAGKSENLAISIEFMEVEDIIDEFGLTSELLDANSRKIWLKNGGYIVIDKTEALTAIDVNSGKYLGNSNLEQTALEVNSEAAKEIMKQIRLKDIGGIIVIDYIDLAQKENQQKIIEIMKNETSKDRSKIDIKGYTELNLVELTRKMMNI
ncbi:MAG: Rne/Rng family ribonuclease [Clostridia bacterium]|nr:Rne/Rng family ribonuclease [Clostridia bacterium]